MMGDTDPLTPIILSKVCRVCLIEHEEMHSVFSELENEDNLEEETTYVYEMLQNVSAMKIYPEDGLPTKICTNCLTLAHTAFRFQQKCNSSQAWLEDFITQMEYQKNEEEEQSLELKNDILVDDKALPVVLQYLENTSDSDQMNAILLQENAKEDPVEENLREDGPENDDPFINIKTFNMNNSAAREDEDEEEDDEEEEDSNEVMNENYQVEEENILEIKNDEPVKTDVKVAKVRKKQSDYYVKMDKNGEKVYACTLCDKTYKFPSSLQVHMRSHTLERPYICKLCGKDFKQYASLSYHMRSHTGEQPYECKICGKRYKQSGTLTAHMRVHTGQRPFLCSVCGRGFRQAPDLHYHMRTHTKEKPFMCSMCGKQMSMHCHLVQHTRIHTGERPYKCKQCDKAFPSSTRLKRHEITHTDLKPYVCEVCCKAFNRSSTLKVHSKIHTDERKHVCRICGKAFIQQHGLKAHMLTHSSDALDKST